MDTIFEFLTEKPDSKVGREAKEFLLALALEEKIRIEGQANLRRLREERQAGAAKKVD